MAQSYQAVIIGGGHNGLVCATYLARAGRSVLVLEAAETVGGAAATQEFAPGYRVSSGAHLLHQMSADLIRDLGLARHGLSFAAQNLPTVALSGNGEHILLNAEGQVGVRGVGVADQTAFAGYTAKLQRLAAALAPIMAETPPRLGSGRLSDTLSLAKTALRLRRLGRADMREFMRIVGMNVFDLLDDHFESEALKGALAVDAVLGSAFGPRSPGTVLTLLARLAAEQGSGSLPLALPSGGMGAISQALAKAAQEAGAEIRTATPVARLLVEGDRACGVQLAGGETIAAGLVISNADPKKTFLSLLGTEHLDTGFVRRIKHLRSQGLAAKLHLALKGRPSFTGLDDRLLAGRLIVSPSMRHLERAYDASKYGEASADPMLEITVPSAIDRSLAPDGAHVLSAIVQYAPYTVAGGWEVRRAEALDTAVATIERYAPGIRNLIAGAEYLAPPDLEKRFGMTGGHWHHADLAFDQFLMMRPVPGAAQYETPLPGLFLCGAGSHPGGGVMGLAGRNAARQILGGSQ